MKKIKIPTELKKMNEIFSANGYKAYLVGGAVRDLLLGKEAHDWDVATNATPEQVTSIFHKVIPTGIAHGTVTVHILGKEIEVTTFRTESGYTDGRHPDNVAYAATIEEDLSRRDFTMNAIAADLADGSIADPFHGEEDIKAGLIRSVGLARERFMEDGLRPVRAIRFACQLGFKIHEDTFSEIFEEPVRKNIEKISLERFRDEFIKIIKSRKPSDGLKLMEECRMLEIFIPEMTAARGCIQGDSRGFHDFDVLDHLFYSCDGAPADNVNVRIAALFHDIGKPDVKHTENTSDGEKYTFYNHERKSAEKARDILFRLKFSNAEIDDVCHLIEMHMFHYESSWSDAAVRRFIIRVRQECITDLFDLRLADVYGMHNVPVRFHDSETGRNLMELQDRIDRVIAGEAVLSIKNLAINGKDLIQHGIPAGKHMGIILNELFETVTDSPEMNDREKLLHLALNIYNEKFVSG